MSTDPATPEQRVRVGLAGFGYWGPNVARNVAANRLTELSVVCDPDEARQAHARELHPQIRTTGSFDELLASSEIDAVALTVPVPLHFELARAALEAGKHVLVEKPLAETVAQCDELASAAESAGRVLMVGHTFEFNAAVQRVKDYLDSGELGEPYYVSMRRTNLGIVRRDENAMWSLAPHDVSILCRWLDRPATTVSATGAALLQPGIEDVVFLTVTFEGGIVGHIHVSWLEPNKVRDATLVCSEKMVVYDDVSSDEKVRVYDKGIERRPLGELADISIGRYEDFAHFQILARAGDVVIPRIDFDEPLAAEVTHFAESISAGSDPITGVRSGRRVVAILEAANRSLANGGTPEPVDQGAA